VFACANPACHDQTTGRRVILGYVRGDVLTLSARVVECHTNLIIGQMAITCPCCGTPRVFRAGIVHRKPPVRSGVEPATSCPVCHLPLAELAHDAAEESSAA
jgi:hypothetical protein